MRTERQSAAAPWRLKALFGTLELSLHRSHDTSKLRWQNKGTQCDILLIDVPKIAEATEAKFMLPEVMSGLVSLLQSMIVQKLLCSAPTGEPETRCQ